MSLFFRNKTETSDVAKDLAKSSLAKQFHRISDTLPEDVFIVGYPKSGNTWFKTLAAGAVHGVVPEFAPPALAHDMIPGVHGQQFYKRYATPMYFKSHALPDKSYRKVVYLLRDGRDAMVSYFHYTSAQQEKVDFLHMVKTGEGLFPGKWHDHVEAWLANPYQAEMMTIKYEDLKKDAVAELKRFCAFVNVQRTDAFLDLIVKSARFEKMQEKEKELGVGLENKNWKEGKLFFRRGEVGSYRDEMPADALAAFLQEAGPTMAKAGYAV